LALILVHWWATFSSQRPCSAGSFFFVFVYKPTVADLLWEKNTVPRLISRADKLSRTGGKYLKIFRISNVWTYTWSIKYRWKEKTNYTIR
jgi:hypothetical protein